MKYIITESYAVSFLLSQEPVCKSDQLGYEAQVTRNTIHFVPNSSPFLYSTSLSLVIIKVASSDSQRVHNLACLTTHRHLYYFHTVPLTHSLRYSNAEELMVSDETYNYHYS